MHLHGNLVCGASSAIKLCRQTCPWILGDFSFFQVVVTILMFARYSFVFCIDYYHCHLLYSSAESFTDHTG